LFSGGATIRERGCGAEPEISAADCDEDSQRHQSAGSRVYNNSAEGDGTGVGRKRPADVAIEAQTSGLAAPGSFGSQFETYMVWAITPAGKTFKLGAMKAKGNRFELDTKSAVRSFAMVITAEPYQQVTRPADTIVLEVPVRGQTVAANCEFLKDGYAPIGYQFPPIDTGAGYPSASFANVQRPPHRCACRRRRERELQNGRRVV